MKSIKPGRGPSMMGGIIGVFMIGFGIVWTALASQAGGAFVLFGVFWTCIAIVTTIYNFKNATNKNRYSQFDIVNETEEPDPLNVRFGNSNIQQENVDTIENRFCPYCGNKVADRYRFCNQCGKELP